jgi:hypothetical protein
MKLYAQITSGKIENINTMLPNLDSVADLFHDDSNSDLLPLLTQPVCSAIAKNYAALLTKNKTRLFDTTNKFISTFIEPKGPSELKNFSCVILISIYESFGREVVSFIPVLLTTILKHLKKEKFVHNLCDLWYVILRNGGSLEMNDSLISKYHKLLKNTETFEALASLYGSFGYVSSYKPVDSTTFKSTNQSLILSGFERHKKVRISTAKSIAESFVILDWDLKTCLEFYIDMYLDSANREQQLGVVESLVHFTAMKHVRSQDFLNSNALFILESLVKLFEHERFQAFSLNRKYRTLNHFNYFLNTISDSIAESTQTLLLDSIIPCFDKDILIWKTLLLLNASELLLSKISSISDTRVEKYRITICKLCLSSDFDTQAHAVLVLRQIAQKSPSILKELLESSLNEVINNSKQQSSDKIAAKSHGLAMIISNLVSLADKDYVPQLVIEEVWKSCGTLIKENRKLTEANHHTLSVCWVSLSGFFTYHDKHYVSSIVDQFLSIWESLDMTALISTKPVEALTVIGHALTAALSFLRNVEIDSNISKLFVESVSHLRTLTSIIKATMETASLGDLIVKRCCQIYLVCIDYVKVENSSIVIQSVSNFSDLPNYDSILKNEVVTPWTKDDGYSNGLTSKFQGYEVDELLVNLSTLEYRDEKDFSIDKRQRPIGTIELSSIKSWISDATWVDQLEKTLNTPISCCLENDISQSILGRYSISNKYSPPSTTCIVDAFMEIFIKSFPYLSTKVQLSLLETLRTHLLSKATNESARIAQALNSSIVMHGIMTIAHQKNISFDQQVGSVLLETIRFLYTTYPSRYLLTLNSESLGILISRTDLKEQIPIFLKKIIDEKESDSRAFNSLVLSYIYRYNASHFSDILEMLLKLSEDAHPIVHAWSMDSLATIIERHVAMNRAKAAETLGLLERCLLDDKFGKYSATASSNLNCDVDSTTVITRVLRSVINSLGPAVKELDKEHKDKIGNLIFGALWLSNDTNARVEALKLMQELIVYDNESLEFTNVINVLKRIIEGNLGLSIGSDLMFNVYEEKNEVFPMTSSFKSLEVALDLTSQLVKTSEDKAFISQIEPLIWISLEKFPDSRILSNLVIQWIDETYDSSWFIKLHNLFNASKQQLYLSITRRNNQLLNKHLHKKVQVDVKDEESQSIASKSEEEQKGEPVNWKFKVKILEFLKQLLGYASRDSKLYNQIASRVSELVKISFASSTSSALPLRLSGIRLLGDIITIYGPAKDPIYPTISLLEQQQAQITSALIPAFQEGSTPLLASEAINIVATFIGSGIVKVSKLERLFKILTDALGDLQHDDEFKINDIVITSEIGRRRIRLSILNSWAELMILRNGENQDLDDLVEQHLGLLLPLWISSLKEFALIRHGKDLDVEPFQSCWINLVDAIGCITGTKSSQVETLLKNDSLGFYYMLYAHCVFSLLKNEDRFKILSVLVKILDYKQLIKLIYYDDIFHESMEIFERLFVTGEEEEQLLLLDITSKMFLNYFEVNHEEDFTANADKLFELVRVNFQTVTRYIPMDDAPVKELNSTELQLVKKGLSSAIKMVSKFPDMIKQDLYATMLAVFSKIYCSSANFHLVPQVLPILKDVLRDLIEINDVYTVNNFYQTIKPTLTTPLITILTSSVLFSSASSELKVSHEDVDLVVSNLLKGLDDPEIVPYATQSIKSIVGIKTVTSSALLKKLIPELVIFTLEREDPRLSIELLILIVKQYPSVELYSILIPLLLQVSDVHLHLEHYIHKRLVALITISPDSFKAVVGSHLDEPQKHEVERLVKLGEVLEEKTENGHIKLKTFE